jgi:predicted aminopeptidase
MHSATSSPGSTPRTGIPVVIALLLLLSGCSSASFYSQAIQGQLDILSKKRPLADLIDSDETPAELSRRLTLILEIRRFAESELDLPVGKNYLEYVDLGRSQAVYCVFAAPEFSLEPKTWCYPFVGCTAYRGYFSENGARMQALNLQGQGYDVAIGGAAAYSTLGWFADPVLNTFVDRPTEELAGLVFHELAHQVLYVADDTTFNESFATTVEREGVRRWLEAGNPGDPERYQKNWRRKSATLKLVDKYRKRLKALYASPFPQTAKRWEKAALFEGLKSEYLAMTRDRGVQGGATGWLDQPLNNAHLVTIASYHDLVPLFRHLLEACRGDLGVFYRACIYLSRQSRERRLQLLEAPFSLLKVAG